MKKQPSILLVEDNPTDVWAIKLAVQGAGLEADITVLANGEQAISFIGAQPLPAPDLVILDLNLPRFSGHEILKRWRNSSLGHVPVLVVTSSDSPDDLSRAKVLTPHYFQKPLDLDEYLKVGSLVKSLIHGVAATA